MLPQRREIASVVVCEDDAPTLELLCDHLAADRFGVLPAPSASDALRLCRYNQPDLLLLDLALPDASGLDVLREIREADGVDVALRPAAAGDRPHRPGRRRRSRARPRVRRRRLSGQAVPLPGAAGADRRRSCGAVGQRREGPCRVGEIVIDPARRKVWVGEREVALSNKEFSLLRVLATDPLRVFPKRELLEEVWGCRSPARTRTLDSHASRLRRKLDPEHGRFVINCWGVGYRLIDG